MMRMVINGITFQFAFPHLFKASAQSTPITMYHVMHRLDATIRFVVHSTYLSSHKLLSLANMIYVMVI
jgi:hypothetical protein